MRRLFAVAVVLLSGTAFAQDISLPDYERVVLDNGVVLLLAEKHDVPLVGLQAMVRGGTAADPVERAGMASLLASLLEKGAGPRDAATFAEAAAAVGGSIGAGADMEAFTVMADFLSRDAELMIELVADMLMRPTLAEEEFLKEQQRSIALLQAAKGSNPRALIGSYGNALLFGDHPYGNPPYGSEESLARITLDELEQHYEDRFGGDRLIVSVVGDFDVAAMRKKLTEAFGGWRAAATPLTPIEAFGRVAGRRVLLVDKPGATQTYFLIGNVGVSIDYAHRAEMQLANTLFGGRFTSMLMTALRTEGGLTYHASSSVSRYSAPGPVFISSYTQTATTIEALDLAIEKLGALHRRGFSEEMITSARNYIMGQFPPTLEPAASLANMLAYLELNGLDRGYIDAYGAALEAATPVTLHNAISEVYPSADDVVIVLIGDGDAIREAVTKYGPVTEVSITEPRFRVKQ
jgi:predicted Zn-dependent peptidase